MTYDLNRDWLINKFAEIRTRILKAIEQLDDEQLNWRPDKTSDSIATLIKHIEGNIQGRIVKGILLEAVVQRNREDEFKQMYIKKTELQTVILDRLQLVIDTIKTISDEKLTQKQVVRNRDRTNLDMLHQCAAHYSANLLSFHCLFE